MKRMERAEIDGVELEYELRGAGEPVVLIHWGVGSAWAEPLLEKATLANKYRLLSYTALAMHVLLAVRQHGRPREALPVANGPPGNRASPHRGPLLERGDRAPACPRFPRRGADARPDGVGTTDAADRGAGGVRRTFVDASIGRYRAGDKAAAVGTFLAGVFGPDYKVPLEEGLPGAFERSVAEADAFFGQELPALQQWSFTREDAIRITQPALAVLGENTAPTFRERRELLLSWLPNVELLDLPAATHLLHVQNPDGMAEALVEFFARHPVPANGSTPHLATP